MRALLDSLVPPLCAACAGPVDGAAAVCPECVAALPWLRGVRCPRCALPRHRDGCPAAGAAFARAWSPLAYSGTARRLVSALKFHGRLQLADLMAAQLAANLPPDVREVALPVVPVPAQPARRRRRGFDAAELLGAAFARRTGCLLVPCLRRTDRAAPLKRASRRARADGRLRVEATAPAPPAALLLDDVHTTGATLDACARALRDAGCERVVAIAYARAV